MTPAFILAHIIDPGLSFLTEITGPKPANTDAARVMLIAIAGQEGGFQYRRQVGGPARSLWQFESGGGVKGVLSHPTAGLWARQVCTALSIPSDQPTVFEAMAWNDHLAVAMARLLLWTDAAPLPADEAGGWAYYERLWRPGKPGPDRWKANYEAGECRERKCSMTTKVTIEPAGHAVEVRITNNTPEGLAVKIDTLNIGDAPKDFWVHSHQSVEVREKNA